MEQTSRKRRLACLPIVLHPLFIDKCISDQRLQESTMFDYALPSERLLPTVAQQHGSERPWLRDLLKAHEIHVKESETADGGNSEPANLALDKHLG